LLAFVAVAVWQNFAQTDNPNVVSTLGQARKAPIVSLSWIPQSTEATTVLPSPFSVKAKLAKRHSKFAGTIIAAPAAHNEVCNEESESPSRCSSIGMVASNRDSRSS
ncbi:MAG TPA: hypothetical protein VGY58_04140, partial [Gemmataceae bacterium]|nr:hypothetical protein [Gemmataceae bacterium]